MPKNIVRLFFVAITLLLALSGAFSPGTVQANDPLPEQQVVNVPFKNAEEIALLGSRFDVIEVDQENNIAVLITNPSDREALKSEGFGWTVDTAYTTEINRELVYLPGQTTGIPSHPCYRTLTEVFAAADQLAATYPNLVELRDEGNTWEKTVDQNAGWDMEVLVLSNRNLPGVPKSDAFIMSGIHAREWAPVELNLRFAEYLLANYETNADVKWLLDYNRIHLVFSTNPDGRAQDEANTTWLWRKNTNNNYCTGGTGEDGRGADLNRNFPFEWEATIYQCDATYSGPSQGSEPETQAIVDYVRTILPDQRGPNPTDPASELDTKGIFIDLHSYSELVLYPWGYTYDNAPNHDSLKAMAYKFAYYNGYQPWKSTRLYPSAGTTDDWAYGELGVPGFCFEVGTAFHQSCSAFESEIYPDNLQALLRAVKIARRPYRLTHGPEVSALKAYAVQTGQPMRVDYTADDTLYSSYEGGITSNAIASIRYSIDKPSWITGSNPKTITLATLATKYSGSFSVTLTGLTPGQHTLFVESADRGGDYGPPTAIFFTIPDDETPTPTPTQTPTATPPPPVDPSDWIFLPIIQFDIPTVTPMP